MVWRVEDSVYFLASLRLGVSLLILLVLLVILSRLGEELGCLQCVGRGRAHAKTLRRKGAEGEDSVYFLASLRPGVSLLILLVLLLIGSRWGEDFGCLQCVGRGRLTLRR